ncbi:MAG: hypothetical protein ABSC06_34080 [Rhodopila sp.]
MAIWLVRDGGLMQLAIDRLNREVQMLKIVTAAALLLASPIGAIASPFCLVLADGSQQCIYVDGADCAREAGRQNGTCQVNANELSLPSARVGEYCLIMPSGYSTCGYSDGAICSRDALLQKGVCTLSAGATTQRIPDAYAPNAGR